MKNGIWFIYGNGERPFRHANICACIAYIHIDVHMNAKWIQTNILFVKHRPKELESDLFVYCLSCFLFPPIVFRPRPAPFNICIQMVAFSSVNKICIVIGIWIFKNGKNRDKHTHAREEREASVNDCRGYVCIAFVINRVGFSHRSSRTYDFSYNSSKMKQQKARLDFVSSRIHVVHSLRRSKW